MNFGAIGFVVPMGPVVGATEIELVGGKFSVVPFADVTGVITVLPEKSGIGLFPRSFEFLKTSITVTRHPLAGVKRCSAHSADGGGHIVVGKAHTFGCHAIEIRSQDHRVAGSAQCIVPPVIGVEHHDVHRRGRHGRRSKIESEHCEDRGNQRGGIFHGRVNEGTKGKSPLGWRIETWAQSLNFG